VSDVEHHLADPLNVGDGFADDGEATSEGHTFLTRGSFTPACHLHARRLVYAWAHVCCAAREGAHEVYRRSRCLERGWGPM